MKHFVASVILAFCASAASAEPTDCGGWGETELFYIKDQTTPPNQVHDFFSNATPSDIQQCLDLGLDPNFLGYRGLTPLYAALYWSFEWEVVETLIRAGADIHAIWHSPFGSGGSEPVHNTVSWSMQNATLEITLKLLDLGVTADIESISGLSSLFYPNSVYLDDEYSDGERTSVDLLRLLLAQNPNLEARNNFGETPLQTASEGVNQDFAAALILAGADVNAVDPEGRSVLHRASMSLGGAETIHLLLDGGADIEVRMSNGLTPLKLSLMSGSTAKTNALIDRGADLGGNPLSRDSALDYAVAYGGSGDIQYLLGAGASINAADASGRTSLMFAAEVLRTAARTKMISGQSDSRELNRVHDVMMELILSGADISARDNNGLSAYDRLLNGVRDGTPYIADSSVFLALSQNCDLWSRNPRRLVNLMFVTITASGLEECMNNGTISLETSPRNTPLLSIAARTTQDIGVLQVLRNHGEEFFARFGESQETLLHIQARSQFSSPSIAQYILDSGISVNVQDSSRNTPLHAAAKMGIVRGNIKPTMISFLLSNGADAAAVNRSGDTPLHNMLRGNLGVDQFGLLIEAGANVNAQNNKGLTPLHYAVKYRADDRINLERVTALLNLGANPNIRDDSGNTPLQVAIMSNSVENGAMALLRSATE